MANKTGRGFGALGAIFTIGCGVAAGIAVYKKREWLKTFAEEITGEAPPVRPEPLQPEEINIVIDRSGEEE